LLEANGYTFHLRSKETRVHEGVTVTDLRQMRNAHHVERYMGPIVTRGVWHPALNVGFGAPGDVTSRRDD